MISINESQAIYALQSTPATSIKGSWRDVVKSVQKSGRLVVTNHKEPEVVILSLEAYTTLTRAAGEGEIARQTALDALSKRFDEQLASFEDSNAADRLHNMMTNPAKLAGKLKAGASY